MKKALIIGLNNYPMAPLHGCIKDAKLVEEALSYNGDGSKNFDCKIMTDEYRLLRKAEIRQAIVKLFQGQEDIALLYFSGHGLVNSIGGYIVTDDYENGDEGISMDEILTLANKSMSSNRIIILDCCHSGVCGTLQSTGNNVAQISEGVTVLTASRGDEVAKEVGGAGLFTSLVIEGLKGGAADLLGNITPGSLYSYVDSALGAWDQRPIFKTNIISFTKLRNVKPAISVETLRDIPKYFATPETQFMLDPSYEYTTDIANEDNIKVFKKLQKLQSVGLVVPCEAEFMYWAAMNGKSCKLTTLGKHYWQLAKEKRF